MDKREERGIIIAALTKLQRKGNTWIVPSQSGNDKKYIVDPAKKTCSCPDHEEGHHCKHLYAVEITIKRELSSDGSVTETRSITFTEKKKYTQNWPKYNEAQTTEKHRFQVLLADLCSGVPQLPKKPGVGRNPVLLSDAIFAATFKIYSTVSSRRFACDLKDAHERGYVSKLLHYNSICHYLERPDITPILHSLIARSALPLKTIESDFAVDSTGFSTARHVRWFDEKYGKERSGHEWVKTHIITGVKTAIVPSVKILGKYAGDVTQFGPLVKDAAKDFTIKEISGDKAYLSNENLELVDSLGATAFIPFKSNSKQGEAGSIWEKMYLFSEFRKEEFFAHYHKRSNVEATFSAIKRKFGDSVRSRSDAAMVNEVLGKILAHNIVVNIHAQCELGIESVFWPEKAENTAILAFPR
jgi:transposase